MTPPPQFKPKKPLKPAGVGVFAIDPGAIRPCRYRFVYLWLRNGAEFWAFPIFVGRNSLAGFRWDGFRWVYFGIDLRLIDSFQCF
jgi:hypothetical protein